MKQTIAAAALVLLVLAATGCGYRFSGGGNLPGGVRSVFVEMFTNQSMEIGAQRVFTDAVVSEIARGTSVSLAQKESADAVITGRIRSITIDTLTRTADDTVVERIITASVDLKLIDSSDQRTLWSATAYTDMETYTVSQVNQSDEASEAIGIERIAKRIAEKLVSSMMDDF